MSIEAKEQKVCDVCGNGTEFYIEHFNKVVCNDCCMEILDILLKGNPSLKSAIFNGIQKKD